MQTENNLTPEEKAELDGLNQTGLTAAEQAELDELNGVKKKEDTAPVSQPTAPKLPAVVEQLMQRSNQSGQKTEIVAPAPKLIEQKPTNEELFEQGVRPNPAKLQAEINRIEPILIKQTNELRSTQNKAAVEYSTYEDNQKYPAFIELEKLYAQANQQTAAGQDNTETVRQIQELRNKPVDDSWRQQGKIQVSESQTLPVPYLKKTPYKNYGELYDATFKAGENYNTLKKKAEQLNSEIAPQKDFIRKQSNYVPTTTDEQGNEYYELNPMESFINGFGNSMDVLNFALMKANPLVTDQELQDEMKLKYLRDNIIFPKQSDGILAKGTEMLGGVTPLIAGGVVAGGGLGGLAVNSLLFGAQDYGGTLYGTYAEEKAKNPDMSDEEAFKLAEKNAQFAGIKGAALGATMPIQSAAGRKLFLNGAEAGAFKKFLAEQGVMAPAFGASTAAQNWFEGKPLGEGADKAILDAFIIGGMTHAIGGVPNLSKNFRTTFENVVAKNYDKLGAMLSEAQSKGLISPETVATIREKSRSYSVVGKEIAPTIEAEVVDKGVELNNISDEIKARKEANPLADVSDLETRAEQINREIAEKKGSPLSSKEQKDYEKLIEKRDKVSKEGEKTELLQSEKEDIRHYEARIEQAKKSQEEAVTTDLLKQFPLPSKPIGEMTAKEVSDYSKQIKEHNRKLSKIKEEDLTPEQKDLYGGKNLPEGEYDPYVLDRIANRLEGVEAAETAEELAQAATPALLELVKERGASYPEPVLKTIAKRAKELNISPEEIVKEVRDKIGKDVEPADRDFLVNEVLKKLTSGETTETGVRPDETTATTETTAIEPTGETVTEQTTVLREGEKPVAEESETIKQQQNDNIPTTEPVQEEIAGTEPTRNTQEAGKEAESSTEKTGEEIFARAGEGAKKTLVTKRAYEGTVREGVKKALEDIGLTREIESQEEVAAKAKQFIDDAGIDVAVDAVRNGDVKGAAASAILGMKIAELDSQMAAETDAAKLNSLELEQAKAIEELGKLNLDAGRLNAMMNYVYKNFNIGYNVENKISQYKERNGGEISPEVEAKFREIDAQIKELNKRIADAETKQAETEAQKSVSNIEESVARESKKATKERKRGKDLIAEGLDELVNALGGKKMAAGDESTKLTVALEKIGKGLIDEGLATLENVAEKVKEYIKGKLPEDIEIEKYFEGFSDRVGGLVREDITDGKIGISKTLIRRLVGEGITDINELTKAVKEAVKDKYPNATEREIRDAITGYGKTVNLSQEEIDVQIRKLKRLGKLVSGMEDVAEGKRPLRSGTQRDKPDVEERAKQKELREAMKGLPISEAEIERQLKTQLDAAKQRVTNQIEDLEREILRGEQVPKDARTVKEDAELKALKEKRDKLKEQHDKIFKDEAYKGARRLELTKKAAERKIQELQKKLKEGDFTRTKRKPLIEDAELSKLRGEKIRLQEEYDKEIYKKELENRDGYQKAKDVLWEAWGLTRALRSTGEFSFVAVQGLTQTLAHPQQAARALKNAGKFFFSEQKTNEWLGEIKSQPWYQIAKKSKLALTEPSAKVTAREEAFFSGWTNFIWDSLLGYPAKLIGEKAYENWKVANPARAFERAAVGYLDTIRAQRFLDGMNILEQQGKNPYENLQDYKDVADAINTLTGRASLGKLEAISEPLTKVFFSPRMWASGLKTTIFAPFYLKSLSPTARKMAVGDLVKQIGLTTAMLGMVKAATDSDDDKGTSVEIDPRSSDFGKVKLGDTRIDPWGGKVQYVVYLTRMLAEAWMWGTENKVVPLEGSYKKGETFSRLGQRKRKSTTPNMFELTTQMGLNKLAPTAGIIYKALETHQNKEGKRITKYGQEFELTEEMKSQLYPIYFETLKELGEDGVDVQDAILGTLAFFGVGVNKYETKNDKK